MILYLMLNFWEEHEGNSDLATVFFFYDADSSNFMHT